MIPAAALRSDASVPPPAAAPLIPGASGTGGRDMFLGIQCLRFVAALMVVVRHATYYTGERLASGFPVWLDGGAGVDVFFIISGFVMFITAPRFVGHANGWRAFAGRRLVRIVPLYWLATTLKLAALLLVPGAVLHGTLDPVYIVKSYLFIPAYGPDGSIAPVMAVGWTLLFEMFFYFVFAVALALRAPLLPFCGAVLLACAAGSLLVPAPPPAWAMYLNPIVLEFLIGMAFARWAVSWRLSRPACVVLCVAGAGAILAFPNAAFDQAGLLRAVGPALLVLGVIGLERHVRRFPPALVYLGAASYSLYMVHPLISPLGPALLHRAGVPSPALSILLCIALALVAAVAAFQLFERPVTARLAARLRG